MNGAENRPERRENDKRLKAEIVSLVQYVKRFREEIAQMVQREKDQTRFESMADQLDAIVGATESATHNILERAETIDGIAEALRECEDAAKRGELCDKLNEESQLLMESCTFQDITGQRVTKIVRSMKFVEERVNQMVGLWGPDEIERLAQEFGHQTEEEKDQDEALLNGPALPQDTQISQDEIDKLFD